MKILEQLVEGHKQGLCVLERLYAPPLTSHRMRMTNTAGQFIIRTNLRDKWWVFKVEKPAHPQKKHQPSTDHQGFSTLGFGGGDHQGL